MFVPFASLPSHARVWIYQADRELTNTDLDIISARLESFTDQWMVHGQPLEASFEIRFQRFIIVAASDHTSGCSIDSSVRAIKEIGEIVQVDFFNRNLVCFKDGDNVFTVPLASLKEALTKSIRGAEVYVFNNLAHTKAAVETNWIQPAAISWLKRYLPQGEVA